MAAVDGYPDKDPERPWWATDAEDLDDRNPYDAFADARADARARSSNRTAGEPVEIPAFIDALLSLLGQFVRSAPGDGHRHTAASHDAEAPDVVCEVCPVCSLLRSLGAARPDLLHHLSEAAHHLTQAAKAVVDAQAAMFGSDDLERIDIE